MEHQSQPQSSNRVMGAIGSDYLKLWKRLRHEPTKLEYIKYGRYKIDVVEKHFGSFNALRKLYGEDEQTAPAFVKEFENSLKKADASKSADCKISNEIIHWVDKYPAEPDDDEHHQLIVASDFHDEFMDPFAVSVFLDTCHKRQPKYICLAGDVMDFYELSNFNKNPSRMFKLQDQIDFVVNNIFAPLRERCPNSQIDYIIGNHEFRLIKFLMSNGQALSSLRCLSLGKLLELDKFKINMVAVSPFGQMDDGLMKNYKIYDDIYMVTHGTATSTAHAAKELNKWRLPGCSGHVHHRQKVVTMPVVAQSATHLNKEMDWISLGCMCKMSAGEEYIQDIVRWQQGFNIIHLFPKHGVHINEYIEIKDGVSVVNGQTYYEKA